MHDPKRAPDYVAIARFRKALRAFEVAAEDAARASGLTLQRYLLLLMAKGAASGEERATITETAERLRLEPHTVTGLVTRAAKAGLVAREQCTNNGRHTWIRLTPAGERQLEHRVGVLDEAAGSARAIAVAADAA